ncbi:molybdenum cofactor cytidylyltransferase [Desulfarculales bacterium]
MAQSGQITAIILAAGLSSRMGRLKPLLDLGGATVLERVVGVFQQAGVVDIRVVLGHRVDQLLPLLPGLGAREVFNPLYQEGMFSSVQAGLASLEQPAEAVFMHPVDIALVSPATVAALLQAWNPGRQGIIYPCHQGRRGHPPLIAGSLISEILAWPGQDGLKALLRRHEDKAVLLEVADPYILRDMDEPGDYQEMAAVWHRRHESEP